MFKKAPKYIVCAAWALVALRLICPVFIESPLSMVPRTSNPVVNSETVYEKPADFGDFEAVIISDDAAPEQDAAEKISYPATTETSDKGYHTRFYIWLAGFLAVTVYWVASWFMLKKRIAESAPMGDEIYLCDRINTPFVFGIFKPKIYLPSTLGGKDYNSVVMHERAHIARRDYIWKPLGFALVSVYWFNPLVWLSYVLFCRDIEYACDEKTVKEFKTNEKKNYAEALINLSAADFKTAVSPVAFGEVNVKRRVKTVLKSKKTGLWIIICSVIVLAAIAVAFLTVPSFGSSFPVYFGKGIKDERIESLIAENIINENKAGSEAECFAEGHIIMQLDKKRDKIYAYTLVSYVGYGFENGKFTDLSGGSYPAVYIFSKDGDKLKLEETKVPRDGSYYSDDVKKLFPPTCRARVLLYLETDTKELTRQTHAYAEAYLKSIGRRAEICDSFDMEYVLLTDEGVSVEVSNYLLDNFFVYHSDYPDYIGTRERLSGSTRYVYETSYKKGDTNITFTKYNYDTKEVKEKFIVDSTTGKQIKY